MTGRDTVVAVGAVAVGGAVGAVARHGLTVAFPRAPGGWPWATWGINVGGCLLIGVLMVLVTEVWTGRLLRPFLGVGVLGGFTTFSTAVVDTQGLVAEGAAGMAALHLVGTAVVALVAVALGSWSARTALATGRRG